MARHWTASSKPTGELALFKEIWRDRLHISEVSGKPIRFFNVACFAHVVSKGSRPDLRLNPLNIILLTPQEHDLYDNHTHKLQGLPEWGWVFELKLFMKSL